MSNFIILNNQVVEGLEIGSIFDSEKYDVFKGVTFSIDQKFTEKYLSNFKETTVVVGIQDSDVQERGLSLELLEYAGADYVGCCIVETFFVGTDDYTIDSDDKFRKVLEISLGKNIEFLEYAGKNLNKDIYEQSKKSNLTHISAPEFKI